MCFNGKTPELAGPRSGSGATPKLSGLDFSKKRPCGPGPLQSRVSPASVYRVLKQAGRLDRRRFSPSKKGTGFVQPLLAHEHWNVDVSYINVSGTFYYLTSVFDGCSRYVLHWELRESMTERDVETIIQRALERHPEKKPRIISDNGPQFIARDFKEFIRLTGVTHVRTSPYYPQFNSKLERRHGSLKRECVRPAAVSSLDEAERRIASYVDHYNNTRLHSSLGYVTPADKLVGWRRKSSPSATANWRRRVSVVEWLDEVRPRLREQLRRATSDTGLGGRQSSAEEHPERRPRGQDRSRGRAEWLGPGLTRCRSTAPGLAPKRQTFAARRRDIWDRMSLRQPGQIPFHGEPRPLVLPNLAMATKSSAPQITAQTAMTTTLTRDRSPRDAADR
jgi:transposase InsO family protein